MAQNFALNKHSENHKLTKAVFSGKNGKNKGFCFCKTHGTKNAAAFLQNFPGYLGTRLGIGKRIMVICKNIATCRSHCLQLVVGQGAPEFSPRSTQGATKTVTGIFHAIFFKNSPKTTLVKPAVVSHKRQPRHTRCDLGPNFGESRRIICVVIRKPMHRSTKMRVEIWRRLDKFIKPVHHLAAANHHNAHAANTRTALIGRFKIYCHKISHTSLQNYLFTKLSSATRLPA